MTTETTSAYPLDRVFYAPSHVALLRALKDSKEGMSGRALARAAGVNHQACCEALERLAQTGVVLRQEGGHTRLVRLDFNHPLVKEALLPLFRAEESFQPQPRPASAAQADWTAPAAEPEEPAMGNLDDTLL